MSHTRVAISHSLGKRLDLGYQQVSVLCMPSYLLCSLTFTTHTLMHLRTHTCTHACIHGHTCAHTHTYRPIHAQTNMHVRILMHAYTHISMHPRNMHTC